MKNILILSFAVFVSASTVIMAHGNHDKNSHDDHDAVHGPKGDKGDDGTNGTDGVGSPGVDGIDGQRGTDGISPSIGTAEGSIYHLNETKYLLQGTVRLFDSRKWGLNSFIQFDARHSRGYALGLNATYKLGKSYEEKRIARLEERLSQLKSITFMKER